MRRLSNTWPGAPAWNCLASGLDQRSSSSRGERKVFITSSSGSAGPGPVSELKPNAPPFFVSSYQYVGGTQSYGPGILSPLSPSALAAWTIGFGQSTEPSASV